MKIRSLVLGPLQTNCWLVDDGVGGPVVVIDPAGDAGLLQAEIADDDVAAVVLTHGHFDHLGAVRELIDNTGAPLAVHEDDAPYITSAETTGAALFGFDDSAPQADRLLVEGDRIEAGDLSLEVIHTPGHTPGSICLLAQGHLFSGDTLFAGSVGRTDFPRGDGRSLAESISKKLAQLDDGVRVHCGHGPDTMIGRERRVNPFFPRG